MTTPIKIVPNYYKLPFLDPDVMWESQFKEFLNTAHTYNYYLIPIPKYWDTRSKTFLAFYPIKIVEKMSTERYRVFQDIKISNWKRFPIYNKIEKRHINNKYSNYYSNLWYKFFLTENDFKEYNYIVMNQQNYYAYRFTLDAEMIMDSKRSDGTYYGKITHAGIEQDQNPVGLMQYPNKYNAFYIKTGSHQLTLFTKEPYLHQSPYLNPYLSPSFNEKDKLHCQLLYKGKHKTFKTYQDYKDNHTMNYLPYEEQDNGLITDVVMTNPVVIDLLQRTYYKENEEYYDVWTQANALPFCIEFSKTNSSKVNYYNIYHVPKDILVEYKTISDIQQQYIIYRIDQNQVALEAVDNSLVLLNDRTKMVYSYDLKRTCNAYGEFEKKFIVKDYDVAKKALIRENAGVNISSEDRLPETYSSALNLIRPHTFTSSFYLSAYKALGLLNTVILRRFNAINKPTDKILGFVNFTQSTSQYFKAFELPIQNSFRLELFSSNLSYDSLQYNSMEEVRNPENPDIYNTIIYSNAIKNLYQAFIKRLYSTDGLMEFLRRERYHLSDPRGIIRDKIYFWNTQSETDPSPMIEMLKSKIRFHTSYYEQDTANILQTVLSPIRRSEENLNEIIRDTINNYSMEFVRENIFRGSIEQNITPEKYQQNDAGVFTLKKDFFQYKEWTTFTKKELIDLFLKFNHHRISIPWDKNQYQKNYIYNLFK